MPFCFRLFKFTEDDHCANKTLWSSEKLLENSLSGSSCVVCTRYTAYGWNFKDFYPCYMLPVLGKLFCLISIT